MNKFSPSKRIKSFKFAIKGIVLLFQNEHNAWIHFTIAVITIGAGFYLDLTNFEWMFVALAIGFVFTAEAFNTAIEKIADFTQPEQDSRIAHIKDLAAGGVLMAALSALTVGLIVFIPKFISLING